MASITLPKSTLDLLILGESLVVAHNMLLEKNLHDVHFQSLKERIEELSLKITRVRPMYDEMVKLMETASGLNEEIKMVCGSHKSNKKIAPGTIRFVIAQIRDMLKGMHREDLKILSEWGFTVLVKPESHKKRMFDED
jgi:hypothetical protein